MESEILKSVRQVFTDGFASVQWIILIISLVIVTLGIFLVAYLKKIAEFRAIKENFKEIKEQQVDTAREVEWIKGKIAAETEIIKEKLAENLAVFTSSLQENQAQSAFIRALYADGIREYSTKQAVALRQSYLVIFEQHSSVIDTEGMTILERVELARQLVMQPLREHLGILDEETINKITSIQNELVRLRDNHPEDIKSKKNCYYNTAEDARKFVKADKISYRHSLISQTIEERKSD